MDIWNWAYAWSVLPKLLPAVVITIEATVLAFILALILGLVFALLRRSKAVWVSAPTAAVIEAIRSTPALIQVYLVFFALPQFGIVLPGLVCGILALGVHYATYCSEVYRAGLDSVERGQWEAATSLNLSPFRLYWDVIVPQAIPRVVPAMGIYLISLVKLTPILSAIAVVEVLRMALNLGSHHFRYIEPITIVGVFFLILSLVAAVGIRSTEVWLRRKILD